jgi:hypothetical protein
MVQIQIQCLRAKRRVHLSSDEAFVLFINSIPKISRRLTVAKAPRIANRHNPPKMDANHVYCISAPFSMGGGDLRLTRYPVLGRGRSFPINL